MLDPAYLKECFIYVEDSGELFWRSRPPGHFRSLQSYKVFNTRDAGTLAGNLNTHLGYIQVRLDGRLLYAHRIIFAMLTGSDIPKGAIVDHINRDKTDNRASNLRLTDKSGNAQNSKDRKRELPRNVHYDKRRGSYVVIVGRKHIGRFPTLQEAERAAANARIQAGFLSDAA